MTTVTTTPDFNGWQRNLLFIWIGVFVGLMGANFIFPFIPFYLQELGVEDPSQVALLTGITASATGLSLTLTAPFWGSLSDRVGRKPMLMRALVGAGVLIALMGLATAVWQLVLLRFFMGAFAGTMGAAAALVAATTPRERTGSALGILQTGMFVANMLGPVIGGVVAAALGLRESFLFCAALYVVAAALVYFFVREPGREELPVNSDGTKPKRPQTGIIENLRIVLKERQVLFILGFLYVLWLSTTFVRPVMPLSIDGFAEPRSAAEQADTTAEAIVHFGLGPIDFDIRELAATGMVFGLIGLTSTIAALSVSGVGGRFGYRNTVCGAAVLTGLLYIPVSLSGSFTAFAVFLGAVGLFQGAMVPGTNALIAASTPDGKQGSAFGLAASMQSLALLTGPLAGGGVAAVLGIEAVYAVIGTILLGAAIVSFVLIREPGDPAPLKPETQA